MVEVTLENVEVTLRKMIQYSIDKEKQVDAIVKKYAKEVAARAKANAPVGKTGNLKASIRPKYFTRQGPAATVFPRGKKGQHRHLVEYGTGRRTQKSGRSTGAMPAKPFVGPAHKSVESSYLSEIRKVVNKDDVI